MIEGTVALPVDVPELPAAPITPPVKVTRVWTDRTPLHARVRHELPLMGIALIILFFSFAIPSLKSRHAWLSIPCVFNKVTHLPCLFCGLTRSFVMISHGSLSEAFTYHLLGPAMYAITVGAALYFGFVAVTGRRIRYTLSKRASRFAFWSALSIFIAAWILKLAFLKVTW